MTSRNLPAFGLTALIVIGGCAASEPETISHSPPEFVVSDDPCRSRLPVGEKDEFLLLSGYEGTAISTVSVTDHSGDTEVARIFIEEGRNPLFIIASAYTDMIWSIEGDTDRVSGFVARQSRSSKGPGAGVIGLPEYKVDFMPSDCISHFKEKKDGKVRQAKSRLKQAYEQSVDRVVTDYTLDSIMLPSGVLTGTFAEHTARLRRNPQKQNVQRSQKVYLSPVSKITNQRMRHNFIAIMTTGLLM